MSTSFCLLEAFCQPLNMIDIWCAFDLKLRVYLLLIKALAKVSDMHTIKRRSSTVASLALLCRFLVVSGSSFREGSVSLNLLWTCKFACTLSHRFFHCFSFLFSGHFLLFVFFSLFSSGGFLGLLSLLLLSVGFSLLF